MPNARRRRASWLYTMFCLLSLRLMPARAWISWRTRSKSAAAKEYSRVPSVARACGEAKVSRAPTASIGSQERHSLRAKRRPGGQGPAASVTSRIRAVGRKLEYSDRLRQAIGLLPQRLGGSAALLHQCCVLLRHLIQLRHRLVHLADAAALLQGRTRDLADQVRHPLHLVDDVAHRLARIIDQTGTVRHLLHAVGDQALDLACRLRTSLGETSDFAGHNRKAAPLLTGARRFHRGIQRQDVGLESDAADDRDDLGDLLAGGGDAFHGADHLTDHGAALGSDFGGGGSELIGLACVVGVGLDGSGHLLHRSPGLLQRRRLLLGTLGEVAIALRDFDRRRADGIDAKT